MHYVSYLWKASPTEEVKRNEDWEDWVEVNTNLQNSQIISTKSPTSLVVVDDYFPDTKSSTHNENWEPVDVDVVPFEPTVQLSEDNNTMNSLSVGEDFHSPDGQKKI